MLAFISMILNVRIRPRYIMNARGVLGPIGCFTDVVDNPDDVEVYDIR